MDTGNFYRFFGWANAGSAAASLIFFGLSLSTHAKESALRLVAIGLLFFAMFALTAATILGKLIADHTSAHRRIPASVGRVYIFTTGSGLTAFLAGLAFLATAVNHWLALPFLLGISVLAWSFKHVHNALL